MQAPYDGRAERAHKTCGAGQTGPVNQLVGRVVVVAGDDVRLAEAATAALTAGAKVAVVSRTLEDAAEQLGREPTVRFRADPRDPDAWERIAMHVEQHLGPVDGVVTDEASHAVLDGVFGADLARRGRGDVVVVSDGDDAASLVTRLAGTPPATPSPPRRDAPGR